MPMGANVNENWESRKKENLSSLYKKTHVRLSILTSRRWFKILVPWLVATCWLSWGVRQQRNEIRISKVQAQFRVGNPENITHWCYMKEANADSSAPATGLMPHVVEWLAGCWTWLEAHNETSYNSTAAIALNQPMFQQFLVRPNSPKWNRQFFHALHFPVLLLPEPPLEQPTFFSKSFGKDTWFGNARSCYTMRHRLWQSLGISPTHAVRRLDEVAVASPQAPMHIGIVERSNRRFIIDSEAMATELQKQFPNTTVSHRVFDDDVELADQAHWFANQQIVVMAHGSGVSNLVFMRPNTQLLELFPTNYFTEQYQSLAFQCGIHHDWYYDGGSNPQQDTQQHLSEQHWWRNQDIHITMDQLKSRVEQMIVNGRQY
eukprot:Nitzschia sp. Nitz4//scaffold11_size288233//31301//32425//NITZ4_000734-RA/size288233-processed-gene-0.203-mRNA-1//-1//CDS//3329533954//6763//frame0